MDKTQINIFLFLSFLIIITFVVGIFYFIFQFRKRKIQEELETQISINQERERIIKDLHDELGGSLSSIRLISDLILKQKLQGEKLYESVARISATSKNITQQFKTIIWSLDTDKDSLFILIEFIKQYSVEFLEFSEIELELKDSFNYENPSINGFLRKNIFLVVKEALNNAVKHANATKITIEINVNSDNLIIVITDDGCGIEKSNPFGNGIMNMKKRIKEINGKLQITNDNGTSIICSFPLINYYS